MLIEFSVENYRSIKDRLTLSLEARPALKEHPERLIEFKKDRVLPQIMILGPNASGKSNVLKALGAGIDILARSVYLQPGNPVPYLDPFKFDHSSPEEPSSFEYTFTVNGQRFMYGFTVSSQKVLEEFLYSFSKEGRRESQSVQFERKNDEYYIPAKSRQLKKLTEMTSDNKLFLAVASQFNDKLCQRVFEYLTQSFTNADPTVLEIIGKHLMLESADRFQKEEILRLLKSADFSITEFKIQSEAKSFSDSWKELTEHELPAALTLLADEKNYIDKSEAFHCVHNRRYVLPMMEESAGTRHYLYLLPVVLNALENGKVLLVDEIESHLHPLLIREITRLFNDLEINQKHAQLIFTTHDVLLLGIEDSRRDQIFLVEKSRSDETTDLFSLADFSPRKDENILKNYLIGRYGAVPQLTMDYIDDGK